jgi:pimeloyl-ACP methyl ester carboxylesterase
LSHGRTKTLDVALYESGPVEGQVVVLLHGFPYDVHSFVDVVPPLVAAGLRVVVPYLGGHGPTRFVAPGPRSGQQAALGVDVVERLDALDVPSAVLAGYDWGGRAACVLAALWPARCTALVPVNGYLVQDVAASVSPGPPDIEAGLWYFWYLLTERGRAGLAADPAGIARVIWTRNSPRWAFTEARLRRAAEALTTPDWVEVVVHFYRHRLGAAPGLAQYDDVERALTAAPPISVPPVTLDGTADGNFPATDGSASAGHFTGPRIHHRVDGAGHHLPREAPDAFVTAVLEALALARA